MEKKELLAPLLPPGLFFRVKATTAGVWDEEVYFVELRMRVGPFSVKIDRKRTRYRSDAEVLRVMSDLKNADEVRSRVSKVVGDYPPKRIIGG